MVEILEFISSCDTLVSTSFHAVYWATLLEIPVIGIPTSSKFYTMKHQVPLASKDDWINRLKSTVMYQNALDECVSANLNFIKSFPDPLREILIY